MSFDSMTAKWDQTLLHERNVGSADASGGRTASWSTLHSGVACSMQPADARTVARFAALSMVVTVTIRMGSDIEAVAGDRLTVGTHVCIVRGYRDASAGLGLGFRADCEELV